MLVFALKRTLALVPILFCVALVTFVLVLLIPGNPVDVLLPPDASPGDRAHFRHQLHLDGTVEARFGAWLSHAVRGDLGESVSLHEPAGKVTMTALGNTAQLALAAILIALILGIPAGVAMGWWAERPMGRVLNFVGVGLSSLPQFWLGLILVYFFSVKLRWLPTGGLGPASGAGDFATRTRYIILPALTVALLPAAVIARMLRTVVLELKEQDFVMALRTRGYATVRILRHVLRTAAPGTANIVGIQIAYVILGALFAEVVFSWPGIGTAIFQAIEARDYPVIQATVLVSGIIFAVITLLVDLAVRALDPRTAGAA